MSVVRLSLLFCVCLGASVWALTCLSNDLRHRMPGSLICKKDDGTPGMCYRSFNNDEVGCNLYHPTTYCKLGPGCYDGACCCQDKHYCNDRFCQDRMCQPSSTFWCKSMDRSATGAKEVDVSCPIGGFCVRIIYKDKKNEVTNTLAGCDNKALTYEQPPRCPGTMAGCSTAREWGGSLVERCCCTTPGCNDSNCTRRACPCTKGEQI